MCVFSGECPLLTKFVEHFKFLINRLNRLGVKSFVLIAGNKQDRLHFHSTYFYSLFSSRVSKVYVQFKRNDWSQLSAYKLSCDKYLPIDGVEFDKINS